MGSTSFGNLGSNSNPIAVTTDQFLLDYSGAVTHTKASLLTLAGLTGKINTIAFEANNDTGTPPTLKIGTQPAVPILANGSETITGNGNAEECDDFTFTSFAGCTGRIRGKVIKTGAISN